MTENNTLLLNYTKHEVDEFSIAIVSSLSIIFIIGTILNIISCLYFIRKWKDGLGSQFLVLLNIVDIVASFMGVFIFVAPLITPKEIRKMLQLFSINQSVLAVLTCQTALVTCYLCVTRTVSICSPFYQISKKWTFSSFMVISILQTVLIVFVVMIYNRPPMELFTNQLLGKPMICDDALVWSSIMYIVLGSGPVVILLVIVIISSLVSAIKLQAATSDDQTGQNNHRAMVTTLLLCVLFTACNTFQITVLAYATSSCDRLDQHFYLLLGSTQMVPINSSLNPVIYLLRTRKLRQNFVSIGRRLCSRTAAEPNTGP